MYPVPVPVPMQFRLYLPFCIRNPFTRFIAFIRIQKLNEALHSIIWFRFLSYLLEQACLHWYVLTLEHRSLIGFYNFSFGKKFFDTCYTRDVMYVTLSFDIIFWILVSTWSCRVLLLILESNYIIMCQKSSSFYILMRFSVPWCPWKLWNCSSVVLSIIIYIDNISLYLSFLIS